MLKRVELQTGRGYFKQFMHCLCDDVYKNIAMLACLIKLQTHSMCLIDIYIYPELLLKHSQMCYSLIVMFDLKW